MRPDVHRGPALDAGERWASVPAALHASVLRHADDVALRWKEDGRWPGWTYSELWDRIRSVSLALIERGVRRGDRVVILSRSRPEWVVADMAALAIGAVVCPIYPGESDSRVADITRSLRPRLAFVEDERELMRLRHAAPLVLLTDVPNRPDDVATLDDLLASGRLFDHSAQDAWLAGLAAIRRSDDATVVHTIDEEGVACGVILTHGNVLHNLEAVRGELPLNRGDVVLSILPLSHMLERGAGLLIPLGVGATVAFAEPRVDRWAANMREVRPHAVVVVPLFLSYLAKGLRAASTERGGLVGRVARWAVATGVRSRGGTEPDRNTPRGFRMAAADLVVLGRLRAALGGRLRFICCGGAPLPIEAAELVQAIGISVMEGYGLTETGPLLTLNRYRRERLGAVGPPIAETEIRLDPVTSEIIARGPQVMRGYLDLPRQTAKVLGADGWLRTGDLGAWDDAGHLRVTGLRKDLLVLASGKKVSPRPMERLLEGSPLISRAVLVDRGSEGIGVLLWPTQLDAGEPALEERLTAEVRRLLAGHASYERPRRLGVLPRDLRASDGELTAEGHARRAVVAAAWGSLATVPILWRSNGSRDARVLRSELRAVSSAG